MGQKEFDENWLNLADRLNIITGLNVESSKHLVCEKMQRARINYSRGHKSLANAQLANVKFLVDDFELVKGFNLDLFQKFKNGLKKSTNRESYFGFRMEIRMAGSLISKNVVFEKSESPDFVITSERKFGIECTSCFLQLGKEHEHRYLDYKIHSSIRKKTRIAYHTSPLVLVIDISNLLFHDGKPTSPNILTDVDKLRPKIEQSVSTSVFESVLTFCYSWKTINSNNSVTLNSLYNRYDSSSMTGVVLNFLDLYYPKRDYWIEGRVHEVV